MRKRKVLAALIMGGLTSALFGGMASAAENSNSATETTTLSEVVVIGNRDKEREVLPGDFVYTKEALI